MLREQQRTPAGGRWARPVRPARVDRLPEFPVVAPDHSQPYPHPARLILILSLAPTIGLGIGRFAYALVLPDMRDCWRGRIRPPAS